MKDGERQYWEGLYEAHAGERKWALWGVGIGVAFLIINAAALHYFL